MIFSPLSNPSNLCVHSPYLLQALSLAPLFVIFFLVVSADAVYWYVTVWLCQYSIASWAHGLENIMRSQVSDRSHGSNAIFTRFMNRRFAMEPFLFCNLSSRFYFLCHRGSLFDTNSNINQSARFLHCQNCPPLGGYIPKSDNSQLSAFHPEQ